MRLLAQAAVLDAAAEGVAMVDSEGRYGFVNKRLAQILGRTPEELLGLSVVDTVADESRAAVQSALSRRRGGLIEQLDVPLVRPDGAVVWVLVATSPIFDERGDYLGALGMMTDVTDRRRAEEALRILASATATLSQSLDYEVTLANVARSVVPRLGDACAIQLIEGGALHSVAASGNPEIWNTTPQVHGRPPPPADTIQARVARTGKAESFAGPGGEMPGAVTLPAGAGGANAARATREGYALVVPLKGRRETLGVITLVRWGTSAGARSYDARDQELAEEIASRAALAVEHARLHRAVEAQREHLRAIADTSRALAAQLDFNEVAHAIAEIVRGAVVVALSAGAEGVLTVRACASIDEGVQRRLASHLGAAVILGPSSVGEETLRSAEPRLFGPEASGRLPSPFAECARECSELGLGSLVLAPLFVQGRAIGLMGLSRSGGLTHLGQDELGLVREIADRAAMAIERARLFEAQKRAAERLRLLADAGTLLAQSLEVGPTLTTLARLAVGWFSDACLVDVFEEGGAPSIAVAARDPELEAVLRRIIERYHEVPSPPPALQQVFDSRSARLVREVDRDALRAFAVDDDHLESLARLGLRSILVVPLAVRGGSVGGLALARRRGPAYDEDDVALAEELGRRAALAVDNAYLFKRATEAIAVRDEFLAIASHELNTPLTPLKMQLDSLRRRKFPPEREAEKLDAACLQVTRLGKLVNQLLDVSRISGGRLQVEAEPLDLAALVDEVVARVSDEAERAGCSLSVRVERPCIGSWDRMRIDQVLTNLLTNAIKYGGGKAIDVELTSHGAGVRLVVRDHGIGIASEHQRRIFERFERAASVRHYGGFGLGLWIARQIVEASGGSIAVESAPGEGSTFVVDLPRG